MSLACRIDVIVGERYALLCTMGLDWQISEKLLPSEYVVDWVDGRRCI